MNIIENLLAKTKFKKVGDPKYLQVIEREREPETISKLILPEVKLTPSELYLKMDIALEEIEPSFKGLFLTVLDPAEGFVKESFIYHDYGRSSETREVNEDYEIVGPFHGEPEYGQPYYRIYINPNNYNAYNPMDTAYYIAYMIGKDSSKEVIERSKDTNGQSKVHFQQLFKRWFIDLYPNYVNSDELEKLKTKFLDIQ